MEHNRRIQPAGQHVFIAAERLSHPAGESQRELCGDDYVRNGQLQGTIEALESEMHFAF